MDEIMIMSDHDGDPDCEEAADKDNESDEDDESIESARKKLQRNAFLGNDIRRRDYRPDPSHYVSCKRKFNNGKESSSPPTRTYRAERILKWVQAATPKAGGLEISRRP
ncbi:hypothetical protein Trydic_g20945 [Trypoxylus dichotomus]